MRSYERANMAFAWLFQGKRSFIPYDESDSIEDCEDAAEYFLSEIANNAIHPFHGQFNGYEEIKTIFDRQYPLTDD